MRLKNCRTDWKFAIATTLAALSIVIPIWIWSIENSPKRLNLSLLGSFPVTSARVDSQQDIIIMYQGTRVERPYASIIELKNTGAKTIHPNDFESAIEIKLAKPSRLLKSQIIIREPNSLEPSIKSHNTSLLLSPFLLNPSDKVVLELLSDGEKPNFTINGRIAGVKDITIQEAPKTPYPYTRRYIWMVLLSTSCTVAFLVVIGNMITPALKYVYRACLLSASMSFGAVIPVILILIYGLTGAKYVIAAIASILAGPAIILALIILLSPDGF